MPIVHRIDHERRLVVAECRDRLTGDDIFQYQRMVWTMPEVAGYDELFDAEALSEVEAISGERFRELAELAASMDAPEASSKLAIVAGESHHFALGRMYQSYRELNPKSRKEVRVFRSRAEALAWLGREEA